MNKVTIKRLNHLTGLEFSQMNLALKREFKVSLPPKEKRANRDFFLLKDGEKILAMG